MAGFGKNTFRMALVAGGLSVLGACAAPPPPPPPPPPKPIAVPSRPVPPGGASPGMVIPAVAANGIRQTVNANLTPAQRTWNLRSAYVVASLNCLGPRYVSILDGYKNFLKVHGGDLKSVNNRVESEWRAREGSGYKRARDSYTTQVYNYFALPPTLPDFCNAAVDMSNASLSVPRGQLDNFAANELPKLESVFDTFFRSFEQYRVDLANWDAQYGPMYGGAYGASPTRNLSAQYPAAGSHSASSAIGGPVSQP
ncbi:MAG: hypothetical protein KDE63_08495, partial [Novosphingobium sp.]|nr:hypothetical protein [Novosphingobium sp.]